jgi:hypothetical protein
MIALSTRCGRRCPVQRHADVTPQSHETHLYNTETQRSPGLHCGVWGVYLGRQVYEVHNKYQGCMVLGCLGLTVPSVCVCVWYFGTMGLRYP